MTKLSTPTLKKALLAAGAFTVLAVAPAAMAAPAYSTKPPAAEKTEVTKLAQDRNRSRDRSRDRGDRSRNRGERSKDRGHRSKDRGHQSHRGHKSDHRRKSDRHHRSDRRRDYRRDYRHDRSSRRHYRPRYTNHYRSYTPRRNYSRHYTPYRSKIGISFNFGSGGYGGYRWAPAAHSFYQPAYGSYGYYQSATSCRRVTVEAWHHGHRELISVKQCSNPWDGTYVVQGSERVINCRY